jgi:hypothetical protein
VWYTDQATLLASACPITEDNSPNSNLVGVAEAEQELWYCDGAAWTLLSDSGGATGCNNGLNLDGTDCQLGGALVENSTIDGGSLFNLSAINLSGLSFTTAGTGDVSIGSADALTATSTGNTTISVGGTGQLIASTLNGNVVLGAGGAGRSLSLQATSSGGDIVANSNDQIVLQAGSLLSLQAAGAASDVSVIAGDALGIGSTALTNSVLIATEPSGTIDIGGAASDNDVRLRTRVSAAPPAACSAALTGRIYQDSNPANTLCWCNGTSWLELSNGPGDCS